MILEGDMKKVKGPLLPINKQTMFNQWPILKFKFWIDSKPYTIII